MLVSRERGERQRVALVAGETEGRYKYEIIANGIAVDPAVIIKR